MARRAFRIVFFAGLLATMLPHGPTPAADRRPIVAVFNIEAKRVRLDRSFRDGLSDYLATKLAGTGRYQVVPRDQLKKRLVEQKSKSYRKCYDQSCQIELGREMAAEKTLATQIIKLGRTCTVNITLYDLKKAAAESASSIRGKCGEDGLLDSIDKAVQKLVGVAPAVEGARGTDGEHEEAKSGKAGIDWVYSRPAGIEFAKTETTVAQYRACVEAGKCTEPNSKSENKSCNWGHSGRDNHPINCVDWNQAKAFCEWAGGRLPTEDEWYAEASNGGERAYPWGDQEVSCDYAIWGDGSRTDGCGKDSTWPVCSKTRGNSVSGLCDMSGNVWEWISTPEGSARVVRGGSWYGDYPGSLRASDRYGGNPADRGSNSGFRCVRSVE